MRKYHHYCYLTTDLTNNMKYFGVRSSELLPNLDTKYYGSGKLLLERIKAEGRHNFKKEILATFETRDEAMAYEEWYIAMHDCVDNPEYYNMSAKSTGGRFDYHEELKDGLTASPQVKNGRPPVLTKKSLEIAGKRASAKDALPVVEKEHIQVETSAAKHPFEMTAKEELLCSLPGIPEPPTIKETVPVTPGRNKDGSFDKRSHHNGKMGGKRQGAGRPKGSFSLVSKKSVERLQELSHDPIENLVGLRDQVLEDIMETRSISARTSLYNTLFKIEQELIKYGYRAVPREDKTEVSVEERGPLAIVLTGK